MDLSIIQTKKEYENVLKRIEELSENPPPLRSDEGHELLLLGYLADHYEDVEFPIENPNR